MNKDPRVHDWIDNAAEDFKKRVEKDFADLIRNLKVGAAEATGPEPCGPPPMPEPVEVWLMFMEGDVWCIRDEKPPLSDLSDVDGPHKIIPGTMSLDELAEHGTVIRPHQNMDRKMGEPYYLGWHVWDGGCSVGKTYPTFLEAQWAATCLAKGQA